MISALGRSMYGCYDHIQNDCNRAWQQAQNFGNATIHSVHFVAMKALKVITKLLKDSDSLNTIMRFATGSIDLLGKVHVPVEPLVPLANSFKGIYSFFSAKSIFGKLESLATGQAAAQDVPPGQYNFFKVISKISLAISDVIVGAKWLTEVKLIPDAWSKVTFSLPFFNVNLNARDYSLASLGIIGAGTNLISTVRTVWRDRAISFKTGLDIAGDTSRIAFLVLQQIPQCRVSASGVGLINCGISLTRFISNAL